MDAVADFIRRDNPARAESFVEEISRKIEMIAERPLSFPARPDLGPEIRSGLHGSYLIIFQFQDDLVSIVRVLHGARDVESLL
ncbi:MAG: type II toxin-antitoxin system RelE/ParE family toxin [Porphyrobacter sp.]|nr:type II toxin-antitoxin system RelE/ParE family toxin [Porphyrobacter sp.]